MLCYIYVVLVGIGFLVGSVAVCLVGGATRFLDATRKICAAL